MDHFDARALHAEVTAITTALGVPLIVPPAVLRAYIDRCRDLNILPSPHVIAAKQIPEANQ